MQARLERFEFAPPRTPGLLRALILAVLAHALLVALLAAGVAWKREPSTVTVSAELWSALPQEAAAPAPAEPPPAPPEPQAVPRPADTTPPPPSAADIALAKARQKAEADKAEHERQAREKQLQLDQQKVLKDKAAKDKAEKDKADKEKADKARAEKERTNQKQKEQDAKEKARAAQEARELEKLRQQNLTRMAGLAGAGGNGEPGSSGTAAQSSGPSAGYAGRIVARIKPNIVFSDTVDGNPRVEVEIRTAPSGAILSTRITQPSGVKAWDDAVVRAIEKTEMLPRDVDGRVPSTLQIGFRPKG